MEISKEIIERFFKNIATKEEVEAVNAYFEKNPDELTRHTEEMEQYTTNERLSPDVSQSMFQKIEMMIERGPQRGKIIRYRLMAAAIILIVAGALWMSTAYMKGSRQMTDQTPTTHSVLVQLVNTSDTIMNIQLTDGSLVQLYQHSAISYHKPFINNKRDISLKGNGIFKVAKDTTSPFTVYAGGVGTTALGTQFKVKAASENDSVTVQLFEGKVIVKQLNGSKFKYLFPGQQLVFNNQLKNMTVAAIKQKQDAAVVAKIKHIDPIPQQEQLLFKNQPFTKVIITLEKTYRADIIYTEINNSQINVTATFKRTDHLLDILNAICIPNGLQVAQKDNKYIIN